MKQLFNLIAETCRSIILTVRYLFPGLVFLLMSVNSHAATKTWTGTTNTDWTVGSNWGGTAPATGDDALIPGGLSNYPVITGSVTIKTINVNNTGTGATVTISGGTLTVTSLLTVSSNGTFNMNSGTATLTGGVSCAGTFNMSNGTVTSPNNFTVSGTLTQSDGTIWMATNTSTNPSHNLVLSGGVINQSGGTIYTKDYLPSTGTFNQTSSTALFRIFRDWKPTSGHTFNATDGTVKFSGAGNGDFTSSNTQFFHVVVDADPKFGNTNNSTVRIKGNFTNNVTASLNVSSTTLFLFNGSSAQQIIGSSNITFSNVQVSNTFGVVSLASNINMNGTLIINAGSTLNLSTFNLGAGTPPTSLVLECGTTAGSTLSGSGTLTLGGNITVNSLGTGNSGATVSANLSLGANRTISVADDGTSATDLTISGIISGAFNVTKSGNGNLVYAGNNSYSGSTTISGGIVALGAANVIIDGSAITMSGGTIKSGNTTGFSETLGVLTLSSTSSIVFGSGSHTLSFAASNSASWAGGAFMIITGWNGGYNGTSGTDGKIKFGNNTSGLTAAQLNMVAFYNAGSYYAATILADGEIVPLSVSPAPRDLNYTADNSFPRNSAITPLNPTVTGYVSSYSVSPALPTGLSLNTSTGIISGTPTVNTYPTAYTITATNSYGSTSFTLTIVVGYKAWKGTVNTDWTNASNWIGGIPVAGDEVVIVGGLTNYPVLSTSTTIKSLNVNPTGTGATMTVATGGSLTLSGAGADYTLISSGGTLYQSGGTITATSKKPTMAGTFSQSGGNFLTDQEMTVTGAISQSGGLLQMAINTSTNPTADLVLSNCIVTQTGGTVYVKDYNHSSGTFTQSGSGAVLRIFRDWKPTSGHTFNATAGTVKFSGVGNSNFTSPNTQLFNVIIDADPKFGNTNNSTVRIAGNFTNNISSSLDVSSSTLFLFNGTSAQQIYGSSNITFSNVQVTNTSAPVTLTSNITMSGTLTIAAGSTFGLSTYNLISPTAISLVCGAPVGSVMSGSGTVQMAGNINVSNLGTGASGATISCNLSLVANRTITVADDGTGSTDLHISGIINGAFGITKEGTGNLTLSGANTFTGSSTANAGKISLGFNEVIANTSGITLNGGTFLTGNSGGYNDFLGTLTLNATSGITLGTGAHTLNFSASNAVTWNSTSWITITGWSGAYNGTSGTGGKIIFGNSASGLTSSQVDQFCFFDGTSYYGATILSDGEVVPLSASFAPRNLSYPSEISISRNVNMTPVTPTINGFVQSYSITPSLAGGLSFNTSTGVISGSCNAFSTPVIYTVTATNWNGAVSFSFSLEVGKSWKGSVNTEWNNVANWHGAVPTTNDEVLIPGGLTNYPVISDTVTVKSIAINSENTGATLTINTGAYLTMTNAPDDFNFVEPTGTLYQNDGVITALHKKAKIEGTFNQSGGLYQSDKDIVIIGALNQTGGLINMTINQEADPTDKLEILGGTVTQSGGSIYVKDFKPSSGFYYQTGSSALLRVYKNWKPDEDHTFNATSGTVQFIGDDNGDFRSATVQFHNVLVTDDPGFGKQNNSTVRVGGNFTNLETQNLDVTNTTLFHFNGVVAQQISSTAYLVFSNVKVSNIVSSVSLVSDVIMNGTLTVDARANLNLSTYAWGTPTSVTLECGSTLGSRVTGTGTLTLGGNITVNNVGTGTNGAIIAANTILAASRTFTVADDGTSASDFTISGLINAANFTLTKAGAGIMGFEHASLTLYNLTNSAGTIYSTTGTLNLQGNFVNNSTFSHNDGTVNLNGSIAQTISGTSAINFYNLTLSNSYGTIPGIIFSRNIAAEKQLTMNSGVVNLSGNTFTLGTNGNTSTLLRTASNSTNWMYGGTFKRFWPNATTITSNSGNYYGLFPVGASFTSSYRPIELNSEDNITTAGYFTANHVPSSATINLSPVIDDNGVSIKRLTGAQFITAISGVTAGTFRIGIALTQLPAGNLEDIRLGVFTGGTTGSVVGNHLAATGTPESPTVFRTGITNLSQLNNDFRIGTSNYFTTPLPVKLISFKGSCEFGRHVIRWTTASEINNDYFTIERSNNGQEWVAVETIRGKGNASTKSNYTFSENTNYNDLIYYRLRQTDFDGKSEYSQIIKIEKCQNKSVDLSIYPNPSKNKLHLSFDGDKSQVLSTSVVNAFGETIYSYEGYQSKIELAEIPNGVYMLHFNYFNQNIIKRFVVNN